MFDLKWERVHSSKEWGRYPKEELVKWVARTFPRTIDRSKIRILDLGAGAGASSWFLAKEGFRVAALDGSPSAIGRIDCKVDKYIADAIELPFTDNSFDAVIDILCAAHNDIIDVRTIVAEMARVLKPGGRVFSVFPAREGNYQAYTGYGPATFLDYGEIMGLFLPKFQELEIDWTMTCEGAKYTKEWFIKTKLKEKK